MSRKPVISKPAYGYLIDEYENFITDTEAAVPQGELSRTPEATANAEKFMKVVRMYTSFGEFTPTLLREFVKKIVVHVAEADVNE